MYVLNLFVLAAELITMQIAPRMCQEPCDFRLTIKVEPAVDNDSLVIQVEAPDSSFYRRTDVPLGPRSPKTQEIWYKNVPGGTYTITAMLIKHDAKTWVAGTTTRPLLVNSTFQNNRSESR